MTANILEVQNVHAGYIKGLNILQGINFRIAPGELVAVIGPNGAGKSTLAKAIFGLLAPDRGKIIFKGKNIAGLKSDKIVKQGMCYVPQITNVFATLSVDENLEMGAFIRTGSLKSLKDNIYNMFPRLGSRRRQKAGDVIRGRKTDVSYGQGFNVRA